ncbi:hypothetical protein WICPIJ_006850 [Wickerhamomyces pijperi]|uniref:Uncharacterized protein n=1 Tax=Wickerhamomyces pijperi TaxID=599730 RepID=A0A9P8Q0Z6_WICPI|nr:hypothetical protein WICPIJ_006850 [Wickerhamomyces pijperi]
MEMLDSLDFLNLDKAVTMLAFSLPLAMIKNLVNLVQQFCRDKFLQILRLVSERSDDSGDTKPRDIQLLVIGEFNDNSLKHREDILHQMEFSRLDVSDRVRSNSDGFSLSVDSEEIQVHQSGRHSILPEDMCAVSPGHILQGLQRLFSQING